MNIAILSISDTRSPDNDASGQKLAELAGELGNVISREIVTDDAAAISAALIRICDGGDTDCVLTTGGTGFADRDNTPEATRAVIEREAPGIAEAMRRETARFTPYAMLSRAVSGIRGRTLIVNFPGSTKAVEECFEVIRPVLKHAVELLSGRTAH
ncbi:MAG: MogA/MoaB family molybdenum cofactor biosynthesis protein [Acidobacteria bacterium ACB1]|nr:Molybdopterin adenylyltransferase [Pyrinomonadaceae bacterium]MCE7963619.1 MogA/MoaB family molybdenum cofactor biosynthesis protein [Acidobacteria bacterium ACB1]